MGDQFAALFQLPLAGEFDHVALPANAEPTVNSRTAVAINRKTDSRAGRERRSSSCVARMVYIGVSSDYGGDWPVDRFER
jgi:hypothetical protein